MSLKKKASLFITALASGGAEHQLTYLANFLIEKGWEVELVTYADLQDHYTLLPEVRRVRLAEKKGKWGKLASVIKFFNHCKSDVVISFDQRNNLLACISLLLNLKPKLIVGERNCTIGEPTRRENLLGKWLYKRAASIVPNSHSQAKHLVTYFPKLEKKISVITNYTDLSKFKVEKSRKDKGDYLNFCIFARYHSQKNYKRFAEVISELKQRGHQFHIDWYGAKYGHNHTVRAEFEEFSNIIEDLDIKDLITLNDAVPNVSELLGKYDAFCLPSLFEGFSNSLSEAICCGLPCVVSDVSDNGRMVIDEVNGYLFNPLKQDEMINAFEKFLNLSAERRAEMGIKSREKAEALFNKTKFINSYIDLMD